MILKYFKNNYFYVFLFFCTYLVHFFWLFDSDEGVILAGAWDLYNNKKIFIDFFSYISPPSFYFVLLFWKIFGVNYLVVKFFSILILFFSLVALQNISNFFIKGRSRYFPTLLYLYLSVFWPLINHNMFSIFFLLWAIFFINKSLDSINNKYLIFSAISSGLVFVFLQHRGLVMILSIVVYFLMLFVIYKNNRFLIKSIVFTLFSLLPTGFLFLFWSPKTLYTNLILFPLLNYTDVNKVSYLPLIFAFIFTVVFFLLIKRKNKELYLMFWIQIFLYISVFPRPDTAHILMVSFLNLVIISLYFSQEFSKVTIRTHRNIFYLFLFILFFVFLIVQFTNKNYLTGSFQGKINFVNEIKNECSDSDYIYAGPFSPYLYPEIKKLNPSPYSYAITNHQTEAQFLEIKKDLQGYKPSCAILNYNGLEKFKYNHNNVVETYIYKNYFYKKSFGNFELYKLND